MVTLLLPLSRRPFIVVVVVSSFCHYRCCIVVVVALLPLRCCCCRIDAAVASVAITVASLLPLSRRRFIVLVVTSSLSSFCRYRCCIAVDVALLPLRRRCCCRIVAAVASVAIMVASLFSLLRCRSIVIVVTSSFCHYRRFVVIVVALLLLWRCCHCHCDGVVVVALLPLSSVAIMVASLLPLLLYCHPCRIVFSSLTLFCRYRCCVAVFVVLSPLPCDVVFAVASLPLSPPSPSRLHRCCRFVVLSSSIHHYHCHVDVLVALFVIVFATPLLLSHCRSWCRRCHHGCIVVLLLPQQRQSFHLHRCRVIVSSLLFLR